MGCLDDAGVVAYLRGSLTEAERSETDAHLDSCALCFELVAAVVRAEALEKTTQIEAKEGEPLPARPPSGSERAIPRLLAEVPGRYQIIEECGRGGQAVVQLARDTYLGREVALKTLATTRSPGSATEGEGLREIASATRRFLREAQIACQLAHPTMVTVLEVGQREHGTPYYTMQLVRGQTLGERLAASPTLAARLALLPQFVEVCHGIAYVHSRGVLHRDLKPSNIMLGEFGETYVLDWGLATTKTEVVSGRLPASDRSAKGEVSAEAKGTAPALGAVSADPEDEQGSRTRTGTSLGTPSYMSPEQAAGRLSDIDERTDVWGLGAVLYEILTGHPPYEAATAAETILLVQEGPLTPVRRRCPQVPAELAAIAERALGRQRQERYQSARELAEEVSTYLTGGRVRSYSYSLRELLGHFVSQHRIPAISLALLLVTLFGSLAVVWRSFRQEQTARQRESHALKEETRAKVEESRARGAERQERLLASFRLAQAHDALASRLLTEQRFMAARIHAAASMMANPAHPASPLHDAGFLAQQPESQWLLALAVSRHYLAGFDPVRRFVSVFEAPATLMRIAVSAQGDLLAAAAADQKIHLWNLRSSQRLPPLVGHQGQVFSVAFASRAPVLASASADGTARLWDLRSGKAIATFRGHRGAVYDVAFSGDGEILASGGQDGTVRLWSASQRRLLYELTGHTALVATAAFSPDGQLVASGSHDGTVRLWSLAQPGPPRVQHVILALVGQVAAIAFSPDGRLLASAGTGRAIHLWDPRTGRLLRTLSGNQMIPLGLAFSPDGSRLAATSTGRPGVLLWDLGRGEVESGLEGHGDEAFGIAFTPDGRRLITAGVDRTVRVWELGGKPHDHNPVEMVGHQGGVEDVAYAPDGHLLASAGTDRTVRLWDPRGGPPRLLRGHDGPVMAVAFSPDGQRLVSAGGIDRTVRQWRVSTGTLERTLVGHAETVYDVACSPDGRLLASAGGSGEVRVWDSVTGQVRHFLRVAGNTARAVAFAQDGRLLAVAGKGVVQLWSLPEGRIWKELAVHPAGVDALRYSPSGRLLVAGGRNGVVTLWDTTQGYRQRSLVPRDEGRIQAVAFSPDERLIASTSASRHLVLSSTESGAPLLVLEAQSELSGVAFSPDGRWLAVGEGESVKRYPLPLSLGQRDPVALLKAAERAAGLRLDGVVLRPIQASDTLPPAPLPARAP
jgi:WD40 repeat protein/serine/threonine protein kinase